MNRLSLPARWCAALLIVALAACSGGSHATLPATPGVAPATSGSLQITVPFASGSSAGSKSPQYVSSGTQSVQVSATPNAGCTTCTPGGQTIVSNLNASSTNCVTGSNGLTCTLLFALAPGAYTLGVSTYSGTLSAGSPTGNLLAENQAVPLTIASGTNSVATAVLNGVPKSFDLVPTQGSLIKPLTVYRATAWNTPMTIALITRDATGAAIVGPGAPATSATFSNTGNIWQSPASNAGVITVTSPKHGHTANLTITATASSPECAVAGAVCSGSLTLAMAQDMAVASRPNDTVEVYLAGGGPTPVATVTQGIHGPRAVRFDGYDDLFVLNYASNTVTEYAPPYTGAPIATMSTGATAPFGLLLDTAGDVFVSNPQSNDVVEFGAPSYALSGTIAAGMASPGAMAIDPLTGDLVVAQQTASKVTTYAPPFNAAAVVDTISSGISTPSAFGFAGVAWMDVANGNGTLTRYVRPFNGASPTQTIASTAAAPLSQPATLAEGSPGGEVIAADPFAHRVNIYPFASTTASASLPVSQNPQCANLDNDSIMYVCDYAFTQVLAYPYPYTGASVATYSQGLGGTDAVAFSE